MFLKLNSLYPDFGLHDSWPFCHALFSRKFLFIFSITCLTFYSWSFFSFKIFFSIDFKICHFNKNIKQKSGDIEFLLHISTTYTMYFLYQKPIIFLFQIMSIIPFLPACCQSILPRFLLYVIGFLLLFGRFFHLLLL